MTQKPQAKFLKDYLAPSHTVDALCLTFELSPRNTLVTAVSQFVAVSDATQLILDGVDLELVSCQVNGEEWQSLEKSDSELILSNLPKAFELKIVTKISPQTNTSLEGLYLSDGAYCTQCEAEGFRKITYFMDRPDVLTTYTVTIIGESKYRYLLSNGNKVEEGSLSDGRHFAKWHDPHKKPSYLFALVAGDFDVLEDNYSTKSGREVKLALFVDKGNLHKAPHAMTSLKKAMEWDESRFDLEYDLDIYMIVAVDFFNMGAMENKGLNVFNSACVLASQETATDRDFHTIESIVGHEYFHNWTGNRVTCRDWFQLSLKEGLTVFRDQEFSSDLGSRGLNRIDAVMAMRTHQFAEDAGPMAHPIRPQQVIEMNNFYTVTVYNKGAEVIRMMHTLLGEANFQKGMKLYFERHDGQAVTCDDFVNAMMDASGVDLTQFKLWYEQFGTPRVKVATEYDKQAQTYAITVSQSHADCDPVKAPLHIPFKLELLDEQGESIPLLTKHGEIQRALDITEFEQRFEFEQVVSKPVPVLLEDFSAPVLMEYSYTIDELLHILRFARSDYARWEAVQQIFMIEVKRAVTSDDFALDSKVLGALSSLVEALDGDLALLAELLTLPTFDTLASQFEIIPVDKLVSISDAFEMQIAQSLQSVFEHAYLSLQDSGSLEAKDVAIRAFKNKALYYLAKTDSDSVDSALDNQFSSSNMTTKLASLKAAVAAQHTKMESLFSQFDSQWRHDSLVMDKWFALSASLSNDEVISNINTLYAHPCFDKGNPNRVRALIGSFARTNPAQFHRTDGKGYALLGDLLVELNSINPQNASRMITPFMSWKRYDETRQQLMRAQLSRLANLEGLSDDLYEKVEKALAQ
ncbi:MULTISPECIES: aminopeptidase N [Pseudoalteromonas]|uniref:aminopeptidase N n=1 Tax=Pseudoalteromonas TaxID=53246 RepID=UPI00157386CD|nr:MULTISPECIES: aminopeptidase N [Pseudoalteromonas]MBR8844669.1 aminopeptidase N [Pseudoalteromonas sp. JC3]NSY32851.1 aminopeptidase N [Pseudoalteromonas sp. JC28]UDM61836.1 aminopeptidase N [Pseudoalteromonas piscicida]WJE10498.1 aminopeptidase N [Pseudoalteromonas sp. JC3]